MNVKIHCHNVALDPELREYAEGKIARLARHFEGLLEARLELTVEGLKHTDPIKVVEIRMHINGTILVAREESREIREAIDLAVDKADEQLRRRKDRRAEHKAIPARGQ